MEEKKVVVHQFKFGSQLFWLVIGLTFFYFAIKKNPTKEDFVKEVVNQYAKKEVGLSPAAAGLLSDFSKEIIGSNLNSMIERNDLLVFSRYSLSYSNENFEIKLSGIGFWDNIYLDSSSHFRAIRPKVIFKNSTSDTIWYALAYPDTNGTENYNSRGWREIAPNKTDEFVIPEICDKNGEFYYYCSGGSFEWSGKNYGNRFSVKDPDAFQFTFEKNPSDDYVTRSFRKLEFSKENGWTKNVNFNRSNADKQKKREVNTEDDNTTQEKEKEYNPADDESLM